MAVLLLCIFMGMNAFALPANWVQMNDDGFFGYPSSSTETVLFSFGSTLYAFDDNGLYQMQLTPCLEWTQLTVPTSTGSWTFKPVGNELYLTDSAGELWMIKEGDAFTSANWKKVTCNGPSNARVVPMTLFNGHVYAAAYSTTADTFDIWRSPDAGKTTMTWTQVVSKGFGDSQNRALGWIGIFNNKLIAATTMTRSSMFGDSSGFGAGIEIWESSTGNLGSWKQINKDGFGTEITPIGDTKSFRTNQDVGGWAIYNNHLYVGTKSHWGAEIWRYDDTGINGWKAVTPPWAGVSQFSSMPGRVMDMDLFQNNLIVAEGFPTGNLAKFDGNNWTVMVTGPNPFDPTNSGIGSMAVLDGKLYVSTIHNPYSGGNVRGDQVYGYPYSSKPAICIAPRLPDLLYDPPLIRWIIPDHFIEVSSVLKNVGGDPIERDYMIGYFLDGQLVHQEAGPKLLPGQEMELFFNYDVEEGEHRMTLFADFEGLVEEIDKENNEFTFPFVVGEREPEEMLPEEWQPEEEVPEGWEPEGIFPENWQPEVIIPEGWEPEEMFPEEWEPLEGVPEEEEPNGWD
jgi:hypothetical protein